MTKPHLPVFLSVILILLPASRGTAEPWARHAIDQADAGDGVTGADGVKLGDINGDGRLDIVTGWEEGNRIRFYLQPELAAMREPWPLVEVAKVKSPEDAVFADLDGDGRLDIVSATEGKDRTLYVHWAPPAPGDLTDGSEWKTEAFPATEKKEMWMYALPFDVDGDGCVDLISGSKGEGGSVTFLENPGHATARDLGAWKATRIADAAWIMSLKIVDTEKGRFLLYSDRKGAKSGIYLVPTSKEEPHFGEPLLIAAAGEEVMFFDLADFDGDGRTDIVAAVRPDRIRVFRQGEDPATIWEELSAINPVPQDRFGSVKAVRLADMTGDGSPEFVITCENAMGTREGVFLATLSSEWISVAGPEGIKFDRIELLDLDGDGDLDIITCEERTGLGVVWYENPYR